MKGSFQIFYFIFYTLYKLFFSLIQGNKYIKQGTFCLDSIMDSFDRVLNDLQLPPIDYSASFAF